MNISELINLISLETIKKHSYVFKTGVLIVFAYVIAVIVNSEFIDPLIEVKEDSLSKHKQFRSFRTKQNKRREYSDAAAVAQVPIDMMLPVPCLFSEGIAVSGNRETILDWVFSTK